MQDYIYTTLGGHISCYKMFTSVNYNFFFHILFFTSATFFLLPKIFLLLPIFYLTSKNFFLPTVCFFTFTIFFLLSFFFHFLLLQFVGPISAIFYSKFATLLHFLCHRIFPNVGIYSGRFDQELNS